LNKYVLREKRGEKKWQTHFHFHFEKVGLEFSYRNISTISLFSLLSLITGDFLMMVFKVAFRATGHANVKARDSSYAEIDRGSSTVLSDQAVYFLSVAFSKRKGDHCSEKVIETV
jgi:5-formaminoimidazole-4-carboxamide-1-beta-D-ribofuranosyl 5'-monophosphate synthetase